MNLFLVVQKANSKWRCFSKSKQQRSTLLFQKANSKWNAAIGKLLLW